MSKVFVKRVVKVLNEALSIDPTAVNELMSTRVGCNASLADHPTIQCGMRKGGKYGPHLRPTLGPIGLINGLIGQDPRGWGFIAAIYNLKCPKHGEIKYDTESLTVNSVCPVEMCSKRLQLGRIIRFELRE